LSFEDHLDKQDYESWSDEFTARITRWIDDGKSWRIFIEKEGKEVVQKFTPKFLNIFCKRMLEWGFKEMPEVLGKEFVWRKTSIGIGNPRWIPVKPVETLIPEEKNQSCS